MSSNPLCKACTLLEGLERGMAESGLVSDTPSAPNWGCSRRQMTNCALDRTCTQKVGSGGSYSGQYSDDSLLQ